MTGSPTSNAGHAALDRRGATLTAADLPDLHDDEYGYLGYPELLTDYPVSGDATLTGYGTINARRVGWARASQLWRGPKVRPDRLTEGIREGDDITTWQGRGTVTRVGTIAGWMMLGGKEVRWEFSEVHNIHPVTKE